MLLIWVGAVMVFYFHNDDFRNFGNPLILCEPKLSVIGWLALMIVISHVLQLFTTLFSFYMTLIMTKKKGSTLYR